MRRVLTGWVLPLRLARREALRSRGRSVLVLVMVGLPVMAVVAAAVVLRTADVSSVESVERRLGDAAAQVTVQPGTTRVYQGADPERGGYGSEGTGDELGLDADEVDELLGGGRDLLPVASGSYRLVSGDGVAQAEASEVDLRDPLTAGLFRLTAGRWPASPDEVVVNQEVLDRGYAVGDRLAGPDASAPTPTVVGVAESTTLRALPVVAGPTGSLGLDAAGGPARWLVGGAPVTWSDVLRLNAEGAEVLSRAVLLDPPDPAEVPAEVTDLGGGPDPAVVATLSLVVAMVLLEVALLAGPAFAVGARRQARTLALLSSSGGTPRQVRRVVLAGAVVLGAAAAGVGAVAGTLLGVAVLPLVQRLSATWFGPVDVPWLLVLGVAGLGVLSALMAALVPAVLASRQDVVAVLAGRRGEPRASRRSPVVGAALLVVGVAAAVVGALGSGREVLVAVAGVSAVVGMVLLVPLVLDLLGRVAGRLPLALRYAVRDAARQRSRTAPAVAAVAATVAAVVALGVGAASDEKENRTLYQAQLADGSAVLGVGTDDAGEDPGDDPATWVAVRSLAERVVPDARLTDVRGLLGADSYVQLTGPDPDVPLLSSYGSVLGSDVLVGDEAVDRLPGLSAADRETIRAGLDSGRSVAFVDEVPRTDRPVEVGVQVLRIGDDGSETPVARADLPAVLVEAPGTAVPQLVLSDAAARQLDRPVRTVGVLVDGATISPEQEEQLVEGMQAVATYANVYVERGYQGEDQALVVLLVLGALGSVLVLGGTLTATFLALSEARSDLATLAAVGASPGTRRRVAAAYALVVGAVGAALGAVVGLVPGIAVAVPLTSATYGPVPTGPYVDVPWLLVGGLVVVLPVLTSALVLATSRSRLPLVARAA